MVRPCRSLAWSETDEDDPQGRRGMRRSLPASTRSADVVRAPCRFNRSAERASAPPTPRCSRADFLGDDYHGVRRSCSCRRKKCLDEECKHFNPYVYSEPVAQPSQRPRTPAAMRTCPPECPAAAAAAGAARMYNARNPAPQPAAWATERPPPPGYAPHAPAASTPAAQRAPVYTTEATVEWDQGAGTGGCCECCCCGRPDCSGEWCHTETTQRRQWNAAPVTSAPKASSSRKGRACRVSPLAVFNFNDCSATFQQHLHPQDTSAQDMCPCPEGRPVTPQ